MKLYWCLVLIPILALAYFAFKKARSESSKAPSQNHFNFQEFSLGTEPGTNFHYVGSDPYQSVVVEVDDTAPNRLKSGVVHVGWQRTKNSDQNSKSDSDAFISSEIKGSMEIEQLDVSGHLQGLDSALNRVGYGFLLKSPLQKTKYWAFTGFMRGLNIPFVPDTGLRVFYAVLKCTTECLVLPEFQAPDTDPTERVVFVSQPVDRSTHQNKLDFGIKWSSQDHRITFIRNGEEWGNATLPSEDFVVTKQKFDVAHFIPKSETEISLKTKVRFQLHND